MVKIAQAPSRIKGSNRIEAPYRINVWLTAFVLTATLLQLVVVPVFLLPQAPVFAAAVVLPLCLVAPASRALLHEAIHGRLVRSRSWNDRLGRSLAIIYGIAFDAIRFGHLVHHRFPRHALDRADIIEPSDNRVIAFVHYYGGLLGWFYLREILAASIVLLPRNAIEFLTAYALKKDDSLSVLRIAIRRSLDRRLQRSRIDLVLAALVYVGSCYLYGAWWPILIIGIAMRALITSLLDNVAHYGTSPEIGAAAHNLCASRWLSLFILNGHLHGVHHDRPEIPWNQLPAIYEIDGKGYAGSYFALLVKQFHGPRQSLAVEGSSETIPLNEPAHPVVGL